MTRPDQIEPLVQTEQEFYRRSLGGVTALGLSVAILRGEPVYAARRACQ
jgi:hypothetical protein